MGVWGSNLLPGKVWICVGTQVEVWGATYLAVRSAEAEASSQPLGHDCTSHTGSMCPLSAASPTPSAGLHSRTLPSPEPLSSSRLSAVKSSA